jgi:hypothetical protein
MTRRSRLDSNQLTRMSIGLHQRVAGTNVLSKRS